ncbi:hypothetical protein NLX86_07080 [Streptomyces sp. A3M-1-3]|uniref:hypothetical protein n=1 Tax=Streptomyces sp. A3M-1-3 TaxID=2962044 RepID=UPI0020B6825D|nr:hypothetical protein [Streptomyces sp. A3M-1-3]MCP3817905.1 hypothetical protein [Streptomyces sp. A3M-1-3]
MSKQRYERYGPDGPDDDRSGSETVSNGPETTPTPQAAQAEPAGRGADSPGADDPSADSLGAHHLGADSLGTEELVLRNMLRGAVQDLEPAEGALDHLRHAVPARRARKRQAVVGMAAAALFIGTAIPAFVHVASSSDAANDRPSIAGHGEQAQGGTGDEAGAGDGQPQAGTPAGQSGAKGEDGREDETQGTEKSPDGSTADGETNPAGTAAVTSPDCGADQLGVVSAAAGGPEADGKVYGSFRVSNISGSDCTVGGDGIVTVAANGAADSAKITVVDHTAGDAAAGLPDPSLEHSGLILKPNMAYEVRFAWVPSESCPTTPPSPDPTPTDGASGASGASDTSTNVAPQGGVEEPGGSTADGSVSVTHTADPGGPDASVIIPNACAGTVYRTGVLDAS